MARSLPLATYLALRRAPADRALADEAIGPPRPRGPLVWCHAASADRVPTAHAIHARLGRAPTSGHGSPTDPPPMIVTRPAETDPGGPAGAATDTDGTFRQAVPPDIRAEVQAFLDHWRPDILVWIGGAFRPTLLSESDRRGIPRLLLEASADEFRIDGGSWMPGVTSALLSGFRTAFATGPEAANRLRRAGLGSASVELAGPLDRWPPVLSFEERERADLAEAIGPRPVWLAAELPLGEVSAIAAAFRHAAHRTHRLLLVAVPRPDVEAEDLRAALAAAGLHTASRAAGDHPAEATEAYVADGNSEMGLWYRLAPVTYLGGSLTGVGCRSPFEAASLGSALVHGPRTEPHAGACEALQARGASRRVLRASDLGAALEQLLTPDRAARLAHAAWDVATAGAEATDRAAALIRRTLEETLGSAQ